jgi:hypothetical protein
MRYIFQLAEVHSAGQRRNGETAVAVRLRAGPAPVSKFKMNDRLSQRKGPTIVVILFGMDWAESPVSEDLSDVVNHRRVSAEEDIQIGDV